MRSRVAVAIAVLAVSGCASVPTSGSVRVGRSLPGVSGADNPDIKTFPAGPFAGQTPTGVVTQYLDALIDSDGNYSIARSFLAPGTSWSAAAGITLYDPNSESVTATGKNTVVAAMRRVGIVNERGTFRAVPGEVDVPFRLVRRLGQWRIERLPAGVFLSTSDAQRSLQPAELFYLNRTQSRLTPAPILVQPDQPGMATTLIRSLVSGPSRHDSPAMSTAIPHDVALVGNVPVDPDGVAEVNLSGAVQEISATQLQRLSAQIVWTLRQVPRLRAVRLLANGTTLSGPGVPLEQLITAWPQYDPDAAPVSRGALTADRGVVIGVGRGTPTALGQHRLSAPTLSADGATVAALRTTPRGTALVVGPTIGRARVRYSSRSLSAPAFDPAGNVVVVDRSAAVPQIIEVPTHGAVRHVGLPASFRPHDITNLAISRDGSRIALVAGGTGRRSLVVGLLAARAGGLSVRSPDVVVPAARRVSGVAWAGANRIVATVRRGGRRVVAVTAVDGYRPHDLPTAGLPRSVEQVAASPGQPILAAAAGGIWSLTGHRWQRVSTGRDPAYAG
jgi:hypothetical protein